MTRRLYLGKLDVQSAHVNEREHQLDGFASGITNQISGASRTYVVADAGRVVGYYCLASGALALNDAPGGFKRNMPVPIPMAIQGRLAVDQTQQGHGLGAGLLRDAVERTQAAAAILGFAVCLCMHCLMKPRRFINITVCGFAIAADDVGDVVEMQVNLAAEIWTLPRFFLAPIITIMA